MLAGFLFNQQRINSSTIICFGFPQTATRKQSGMFVLKIFNVNQKKRLSVKGFNE